MVPSAQLPLGTPLSLQHVSEVVVHNIETEITAWCRRCNAAVAVELIAARTATIIGGQEDGQERKRILDSHRHALCQSPFPLVRSIPGPVSVSGCSVIGEGGDDVLIWRRRLVFSRWHVSNTLIIRSRVVSALYLLISPGSRCQSEGISTTTGGPARQRKPLGGKPLFHIGKPPVCDKTTTRRDAPGWKRKWRFVFLPMGRG